MNIIVKLRALTWPRHNTACFRCDRATEAWIDGVMDGVIWALSWVIAQSYLVDWLAH